MVLHDGDAPQDTRCNAFQPGVPTRRSTSQTSAQVLLDAGVLDVAGAAVPVDEAALVPDFVDSDFADSDFPPVSFCVLSAFFAAPAVLLPPLLKSVTYQPPPFN